MNPKKKSCRCRGLDLAISRFIYSFALMGYYLDFPTHICVLYINVDLESCNTYDYLMYERTPYFCYSAILLQCTHFKKNVYTKLIY